ncbi:DNA-binding NtrC family response regulator [Pararhizobium capsulatum DSM 1112]|uniref:DNA-binding NtrC family response regulator n=1 Tax=Pararhizobium capsulatum DSM 1112 TaxID=1121113 RepID=A0ABU0BL78_9HYPH|nr:response regulator [Pararhizobium capsulatum]MDQ0319005.1 DNA-binding NtrC family response regulator [Pararhizobium capsulatum DSM 1112]
MCIDTILILEDEPFISLDIECSFLAGGYSDVLIVSTCVDALTWLESHTPLAAVIDVSLKDGNSAGVASLLNRRGVPFIVYSGRTPDSVDDAVFLEGVWYSKPGDPSRMVELISNLTKSVHRLDELNVG